MTDTSTIKDKKLTPKQARFVQEYVRNGFNGTQAAIAAGYSEKSAKAIAAENLTKPVVLQYVDEFKQSCENAARVTFEWKLDVLRRGIDACLDGSTSKDGLTNTASLSSLVSEMNKMLGHYKPSQMEAKHAVAMTDDKDTLSEMLDSFESRMKQHEQEY